MEKKMEATVLLRFRDEGWGLQRGYYWVCRVYRVHSHGMEAWELIYGGLWDHGGLRDLGSRVWDGGLDLRWSA